MAHNGGRPALGFWRETAQLVGAVGRAMGITLRNLFRKPVTVHYPDVKRPYPDRFRGILALTYDPETGEENCIGSDAIVMLKSFDLATADRRDLLLDKDRLHALGREFEPSWATGNRLRDMQAPPKPAKAEAKGEAKEPGE